MAPKVKTPAHTLKSSDPDIVGRWEILDFVVSDWGDHPVSQGSTFKDTAWDFRKEGLEYFINVEAVIGSSKRTHFPMIVLFKMIAYCLIRFAITERGPRTVYNIIIAAKSFAQWLIAKGFLVAQHDGGYFKLPRDIQQEDFAEFFTSINALREHDNTKWDKVRLISQWWRLSQDEGMLPSFLKLESDPFDGKPLSYFKDYEVDEELAEPKEISGWQAIPLEYAFPLATAAIDYIEKYAQPLIKFHQVIYKGIVKHKPGSTVTRGRVYKVCAELGMDVDNLGRGLPFKFEFVRVDSPSNPKKFTYRLERKDAERCISHIKRAAITIILFTTGMRSWEIRNLKVGCCVPDPTMGIEGFYRMTVTVRKTSREYQQGHVISIPVPEATYQAVRVLEQLGTVKRREDYLLAPLMSNEKTNHVSGQLSNMSLINYVKAFARDVGLAYEPHPHQFRKTIAGWFVLNSPVLGPLLVMRLFSHKSMNMTEMYLRNNPLIIEAREEILVEQSLKIVGNIGKSAQAGKLAGAVGERIKME